MAGAHPHTRELMGPAPVRPTMPLQIGLHTFRAALQGMRSSEPTGQQTHPVLQMPNAITPHGCHGLPCQIRRLERPVERQQRPIADNLLRASQGSFASSHQRVDPARKVMSRANARMPEELETSRAIKSIGSQPVVAAAPAEQRLVGQWRQANRRFKNLSLSRHDPVPLEVRWRVTTSWPRTVWA